MFEFLTGGGGSFLPLRTQQEAVLPKRFSPEVEQMDELLKRELPEWRRQPGVRPRLTAAPTAQAGSAGEASDSTYEPPGAKA